MTCQSEAPSYPVRGEDNEMETWGAGVIFQSNPCPALLNYTCSPSCPRVHSCSVGSHAEPVTGESVGDVWRVAGRQWRALGGSDCWVRLVSRSTLCLFPLASPRGWTARWRGRLSYLWRRELLWEGGDLPSRFKRERTEVCAGLQNQMLCMEQLL